MGYSNNKWRKLLTILMIVNLCFILFAKINRVFGSTDYTSVTINNTLYDINISYITKDFDYYILVWGRDSNTRTHIDLFCSDYEMTFTNGSIANTQGSVYIFSSACWNSFSNCVNYFNNTTYDVSLGTHTFVNNSTYTTSQSYAGGGFVNNAHICLANYDVKDTNNNIVFNNNVFISPHFDNITEIENGYPDGVFISRGSYSEDDALYFHLLKIIDTVADGNQSTYYYESKVFKLIKDNKYYRTYPNDTENKYSYYYIQRSALTLDTNSSYLYVLSNSGDSITNSYGILQPDIPGGIYDVVESDTAGVITEQDSINDKIANINNNQQDIANSQQDIANNSNNITNFLTENTISNDTNNNIDTNLDFNNQNSTLNNLNNGFFTRLTNMLTNISNYDLAEDTYITLPLPNSQNHLELHSNIFYNNVNGSLRTIINAFWTFLFTFYLWKFINKIYIAVSSGSILDNFSSSGETITNDML